MRARAVTCKECQHELDLSDRVAKKSLLMANGMTYDEGLDAIQARFESLGVQPHTPFLRGINEESKQRQKSEADVRARKVLGL